MLKALKAQSGAELRGSNIELKEVFKAYSLVCYVFFNINPPIRMISIIALLLKRRAKPIQVMLLLLLLVELKTEMEFALLLVLLVALQPEKRAPFARGRIAVLHLETGEPLKRFLTNLY